MQSPFTVLVGIEHPLVQAPMAGGMTPPRLVAEVCEAGALGSVAGAMLARVARREEIARVRSRAGRPFGVTLFAPLPPPVADEERMARVAAVLAPPRERLGLGAAQPPARPPWRFEDQLAVV